VEVGVQPAKTIASHKESAFGSGSGCPSPQSDRTAGDCSIPGRNDKIRYVLQLILVLVRAVALACRGQHELVLENLALRQQLHALKRTGKRAHLEGRDRLFWMVLAQTWRNWRAALVLVQPDTVVRWHREWLRRRWTQRSARSRAGRPRTNVAIRTLVNHMATANPLWGAPRIHGELLKLSVEVSERTVSRLVQRPHRPASQTWRTFLTNHVGTLASIDFFTVPTFTGRVLFVLVVLMHHRRRIVHVNVTEHPTAAWTAQQLIDAFPDETAPRWLLRDRDAIYGDAFRRRVAGMGTCEVLSSPSSPWQNPYAERLIGAIRRDFLDHVIVLGEQHLRRTLAAYLTYYHGSRTHLSLEKDAPTPRPVQAIIEGDVVAFPEVGGLHHRYERRAA
jgi:putative transposase